jgi:hypothetical protein
MGDYSSPAMIDQNAKTFEEEVEAEANSRYKCRHTTELNKAVCQRFFLHQAGVSSRA